MDSKFKAGDRVLFHSETFCYEKYQDTFGTVCDIASSEAVRVIFDEDPKEYAYHCYNSELTPAQMYHDSWCLDLELETVYNEDESYTFEEIMKPKFNIGDVVEYVGKPCDGKQYVVTDVAKAERPTFGCTDYYGKGSTKNSWITQDSVDKRCILVESAVEKGKTMNINNLSGKRKGYAYIIIQAETPLKLEKEVNKKVNEGYTPQGGMVYDSYPESVYPYKQAMEHSGW